MTEEPSQSPTAPPSRLPGQVEVRRFHYAGALAAQAISIVSGILAFRLVAAKHGSSGFGLYQLGRGMVAFLQPALALGLGVGIPRFMAREETSLSRRDSYFYCSSVVVLAWSGLVLILIALTPRTVSRLVFGSPQYAELTLPVALAAIAVAGYLLVYSFLRGSLQSTRAHVLQVCCLAVTPLFAAIFAPDIRSLFLLIAGLTFALNLGMLLLGRPHFSIKLGDITRARPLILYSMKRVPGEFLFIILFVGPQTISAHLSGVEIGGFVGLAVSTLALMASAFSPIGVVMLPEASQLFARGDVAKLRARLESIVLPAANLAAVTAVLLALASPLVVRLLLGAVPTSAVIMMRLIALAVPPYVLFVVARSALDAVEDRALNTKNAAVASFMFLVLSTLGLGFRPDPTSIMLSLIFSLWVLGFLTLRALLVRNLLDLRSACRAAISPRKMLSAVLVGGVEKRKTKSQARAQ